MRNTKLLGILNVTPDSFSDGGTYYDAEKALAAITRMVEEGVDAIDIGAESTRPGAMPITAEEEWRRLKPVLSQMQKHIPISIDTRHVETAKNALELGADWINDVSGFSDKAMIEAVRNSHCVVVVMHSLSIPADSKQVLPPDTDVVQILLDFACERIAILQLAGIARERIIFDPGIGFGKTAAQSLAILRQIDRFSTLGVQLLIGHSRKSFLGEGDRDQATLAMSASLIGKVDWLRVHDIAAHRHMLDAAKEVAYG